MDKDFFLGILISMVEGGAQIPIMLNVGGKIVCGDMISERDYFEQTASKMNSDTSGLRDVFADIPSIVDKAAMDRIAEEDDPEEAADARKEMAESFVHLKNSFLLSENGNFVNLQGSFWRGKVEAVVGFWLGRPEEAPV